MASVLAGFRPVKHLNGSPYNGQVNRYIAPTTEVGAINVGDLVILSANDSGDVYPAVTRATGTTAVVPVGVVVGFQPDYSNLNLGNYGAGATRRVCLVADSPDIIFAAPQDAVGGVVATASIGLNIALVPGSASTASPYASTMLLDSSDVAVTNTYPFRIMGVTDAPDNSVTSTARPAELLVKINTHRLGDGPGVAGI